MPTPDLQTAKILVIDDEPAVVEMLEQLFRVRGLGTVRGTSDPRAAVSLFIEVQPDLVLLDLKMPHMDGMQVLEALRECEQPNDGHVPILVITSDQRVESRHAALGRGATDFLSKPFDAVEIILRASNLLETRFLHRQLVEQNKVLAEQLREQQRAETALTAARDEAEQANRAKSEFLSRMSHELRTPLNGILGFAQILEMNALEGQPGACVTHILKAGRHLLSLINEVLDLSGIEAGRVTFSIEPVRVLDVAREALDLVRPLAAPRGLRLELPEETSVDAWVLADRQRLQQVLLNLLANAVKFNREGGAVTLSWEEKPSERLRILVRDTGQGIAPENLERLFVPFERLDAERTEVEGTGLGLSLSKRLINSMGGEIGVESNVGTGSTFWIKLPRSSSPLARLHETGLPPEPVAQVHPGTILYIEDNLANLALIEYLFAQRPQLKLLAAMQGRLGIELAREHQPDLILLDLHLPDIMGDKVLSRLKGDAATGHIPVAMLTADATPAQEARLIAAGADHYLTKPIDVPRLLRLIETTLGSGSDDN